MLVLAAALFWIAWLLMPGVGVTDAKQIFELVSSHRELVATSVVVQLISAVLYIPAMMGIARDSELGRTRLVQWGAGLLFAGAMGSAADAVLHLLAYAMTTPGLERGSLMPVMAFMQGPGLALLAPLLLSFFAGGAVLSVALVRVGAVSRWNAGLHFIAVAVAAIGGWLASGQLMSPRLVGLTVLAFVSAAQAWVGIAMWKRRGLAATGGLSWPFRFDAR
jgi:hypothetical protein